MTVVILIDMHKKPLIFLLLSAQMVSSQIKDSYFISDMAAQHAVDVLGYELHPGVLKMLMPALICRVHILVKLLDTKNLVWGRTLLYYVYSMVESTIKHST